MSSLHSGYLPNPIISVFWVLGVQFALRLDGKINTWFVVSVKARFMVSGISRGV